MIALVFAGPTIDAAAIERAFRDSAPSGALLRILPPASQGDVHRAVLRERPRAIGLIDGVFLDAPSVWHRELLWAMAEGVHCLGAASMGALRAAELDRFGMRGVGRIYEAYRDGAWPGFAARFEDDDEVAVAHAPKEAGHAPLSDAMVDLRDTLLAAEAAGLIDRAGCESLAARMKALPFAQRSLARLAEAAGLPSIDRLAVRRKRIDAEAMVVALGEMLAAAPGPFRAPFRFERALVWERFIADAPAPVLDEDELLVLEELSLDPVLRRATRRAAAAKPLPKVTDRSALSRALGRFRRDNALWRAADIEAWRDRAGLDAAGFARLIEEEAAIEAAPIQPVSLLAALRSEGRYQTLLARACDKRRRLGGAGEVADPLLDSAAAAWFAEAVGEAPDDAGAVRREYLYRRAVATEARAS